MQGDAIEIDGERRPKARLLTLSDLDKRTKAAQRALDLHERLVAERGGSEVLSVLRYQMTQSVAVLCAMIEDLQAKWISGQSIDPATIATLLNARRREAELIGIDPAPRDITPALCDYLAAKPPVIPDAGNRTSDVPNGNTGPS